MADVKIKRGKFKKNRCSGGLIQQVGRTSGRGGGHTWIGVERC